MDSDIQHVLFLLYIEWVTMHTTRIHMHRNLAFPSATSLQMRKLKFTSSLGVPLCINLFFVACTIYFCFLCSKVQWLLLLCICNSNIVTLAWRKNVFQVLTGGIWWIRRILIIQILWYVLTECASHYAQSISCNAMIYEAWVHLQKMVNGGVVKGIGLVLALHEV
jgi:hypothetical protein